MTRGRMILGLVLLIIGLGLTVMAAEKPVVIYTKANPHVTVTPDPNWDLKHQMGIVENPTPDPGDYVPDFDENGKYGLDFRLRRRLR